MKPHPHDTASSPDPVAGRVSVLMPDFNEVEHIYRNLRETAEVIARLCPDYEIVAADDGSRDDTLREIERAARENPRIRCFSTRDNRGKGWALKKAFGLCRGTWVFFLDSDLDIHPQQFLSLLRVQKATGADVVIGSKRHPDSTLKYPFSRRIVSAAYFFLVKALFGLPLRDTQTGIKLFKRTVLEAIFPRILVKQYAFDLEILVNAHRRGYPIAEAPVVVDYRGKFGRIGPRSIWTILIDTLAVFYRAKILKYHDRPLSLWARTPPVSIIIACREITPYLRECLEHIARLE
ncbi:MAG: glycosyltransferase, partial [Candidatus Aureabacteria bacterium]|nr:glycosyltransferase [Candidatus Auribacterota bacterium]